MPNPFDKFDPNPFDQFDGGVVTKQPPPINGSAGFQQANPFDKFDPTPNEYPSRVQPSLTESITRPFKAQAYKAAEALNLGMAELRKGLHEAGKYVTKKTGIPTREVFGTSEELDARINNTVKIYTDNADYWNKKAKEVGTNVVDETIGEAVGGAIPGITEFMMNVPYAALRGATEAEKTGDSELMGALVGGTKRALIGKAFKYMGPLKQPLRSTAMGATFAVDTAASGGDKGDIAKGFATGALYGAAGGKGQVGGRDAIKLYKETRGKPAAKEPAVEPPRPPVNVFDQFDKTKEPAVEPPRPPVNVFDQFDKTKEPEAVKAPVKEGKPATPEDMARLGEKFKVKPEQGKALEKEPPDITAKVEPQAEAMDKEYETAAHKARMVDRILYERKPEAVKTALATEKMAVKNRVYSEMSIKMKKAVRTEELKSLREGIKLRTAKEKIINQLKNKAIDIADIKRTIYITTKEALPLKERGRLLATVTNAKTRGDLAQAYTRILKERNKLIRKDLIGEIEKTVETIESIPLKWQDRITTALEGYSFKGMTNPTIDKLTKLRGFLERQPEARLRFGAKTRKIAKRIPELEKEHISNMPLKDLIKLHGEVTRQHALGKLVKGSIERTAKMQQEQTLKKLGKTSRNMDVTSPRRTAEPTTGKIRRADARAQMRQDISNGYLNYVSTDIGFEVLDGNVRRGENTRTFKEPFDEAYLNFKEANTSLISRWFEFKDKIQKKYQDELSALNHALSGNPKAEFTDTMMERIMVHATRAQEGGAAKLANSGLTERLVDSVQLTKPEMELYKEMRQTFDELHPYIDRVLRDVHNRKLDKIKNYFSWQTDFNNSGEVFQRLENDYMLSSRTKQGFTLDRTIGGKQVVKMNAEEVFLKHLNDASYFIHTEKIINKMGKLARDPAYQSAVGTNGQKWVLGWVDLMARKGIPEGYKPNVSTKILNNIGGGTLGLRLSPIVKQPIAKITSAALLGKHTFRYDGEYFRHGLWKYVPEISKQLKNRSFDDPSFTAFAENKKLAEWQRWGYEGIRAVDLITANNVWYAAYRKYHADNGIKFDLAKFKEGKAESKDAVRYADYVTRRTQGTAEFKDLASMLTGKNRTLFRAVLQFQSFILNESYLIPHDAINMAIRTEKDYGKALGIMSAYVLAGLAEEYISTGMAQLFSSEKYAKKAKEKEFSEMLFDAIVTKIPFVNNVYSAWKYDSTGVPIFDVPLTALAGVKSVTTGKSTKTKLKGTTRALEVGGTLYGIPGSGQAGQISRKIIDATMEDAKRGPRKPSAPKRR